MKRKYIPPVARVINIAPVRIMAGSGTQEMPKGDGTIDNEEGYEFLSRGDADNGSNDIWSKKW